MNSLQVNHERFVFRIHSQDTVVAFVIFFGMNGCLANMVRHDVDI